MLLQHILIFVVGLLIGAFVHHAVMLPSTDGFKNIDSCSSCGQQDGDAHLRPAAACPECKQPDMSKYVLKSSIPPCPALPDMSNYILKSECPPTPDLSNSVLKSSTMKRK